MSSENVPKLYSDVLDGLAAIFLYEKKGILAKTLHLYKYELFTDYGESIFQLWENNINESLLHELHKNIDLISWIPLHRKKANFRGFNQAEMLALHIPLKKPKLQILIRTFATSPQMLLHRDDRLENMKNVFELNKYASQNIENIRGKKILLVDDVITTGATLGAAASALKCADAAAVFALVLARQKV